MTGKKVFVAGIAAVVVLAAALVVGSGNIPAARTAQPAVPAAGSTMNVQGGSIGAATTANAAEAPVRGITVVGQGEASGAPDVARANLGVEVFAPTVAEATKENNDKMAAVIAKLKDLGIAEKDIQTSGYSINPERNVSNGAAGQMTGYRVANMVQVTIRDLSKVGTVLDQVTQAGANNVYGVNFSIDDPAKLQADARAKAIADAQARADDLAKLSGVQRGDVLGISEVIGASPMPMAARSDMAVGDGAAPVQPGELQVQVQIQVTYAIR